MEAQGRSRELINDVEECTERLRMPRLRSKILPASSSNQSQSARPNMVVFCRMSSEGRQRYCCVLEEIRSAREARPAGDKVSWAAALATVLVRERRAAGAKKAGFSLRLTAVAIVWRYGTLEKGRETIHCEARRRESESTATLATLFWPCTGRVIFSIKGK